MAFPSRKRIYDSDTIIQSYRGSISNSSVHTTSTAATRKDLFDNLDNGPGGATSISDRKSFHSLEKPTFRFRNQSQSTIGTIRGAGSVRSSTATSTSEEETHSLGIPSFEGEDESLPFFTPRSSLYSLSSRSTSRVPPSALLDDLLTKQFGDSQPFATTETSTADTPLASHPSSLPPQRDRRIGTTSLSFTVPLLKQPFLCVRYNHQLQSLRDSLSIRSIESPHPQSRSRICQTLEAVHQRIRGLRHCRQGSLDTSSPPTQLPQRSKALQEPTKGHTLRDGQH